MIGNPSNHLEIFNRRIDIVFDNSEQNQQSDLFLFSNLGSSNQILDQQYI